MSDRDDLDWLSQAWLGISNEPALSVPAALNRRRRQQAILVLETLGCGLALASALFFWLAGDGLVYRVSAAVLLAAAVLSGVVVAKTRVGLGRWADWTPEGVLAFRLRECEVALLNAKYALQSAATLVAFAAFVWLAATFEWDALPPDFHYLYASVVAVTVLIVSIWAAWRIRKKRAEHAHLHALLEELRNADAP